MPSWPPHFPRFVYLRPQFNSLLHLDFFNQFDSNPLPVVYSMLYGFGTRDNWIPDNAANRRTINADDEANRIESNELWRGTFGSSYSPPEIYKREKKRRRWRRGSRGRPTSPSPATSSASASRRREASPIWGSDSIPDRKAMIKVRTCCASCAWRQICVLGLVLHKG